MKRFTLVLGLAAGLCVGAGTAWAGRIPAPGVDTTRAQAHASVWYTETFRAGELAVVSIRGDGDTDLDLYIYDASGRVVARGIGLSDRETVSFVPLYTGTFRVEVRNLGGVWNQFTLTTN